MPILHVQASAKAQTRDRKIVQLAPEIALSLNGPRIQVSVNVDSAIAAELARQGKTIPDPIPGIGLIDTGASATCIDDDAARTLGAPAVDVVKIASVSHASTEQNVYPIQIEVTGLPMIIKAPHAIGAPLAAQGLLVLIGRDLLQHCTLFYNGTTGEVTLSI